MDKKIREQMKKELDNIRKFLNKKSKESKEAKQDTGVARKNLNELFKLIYGLRNYFNNYKANGEILDSLNGAISIFLKLSENEQSEFSKGCPAGQKDKNPPPKENGHAI